MLTELLAQVSNEAWTFLAVGLPIMGVISVWPHLTKRWHEWRRDRRLASDPYILQEELAEFNWKIDEGLETFEWRSWLARYSGQAALFAGVIVAVDIGYDLEWQGVLAGVVVLSLLYQLWRKMNDPEELQDAGNEPFWDRHNFPDEAIYGFFGAILMVGLLLGFYWMFF